MSQSTDARSWKSSEDDEQDNLNLLFAQELDQNVLEIDPGRFFHTFLGGVPGTSAQACLDALKDPNSASFLNTINSQIQTELHALSGGHHPEGDGLEAIWAAILGRLPTCNPTKRQFDQLVAGAESEADLCEPLASLLTFINLRRRFVVVPNGVPQYTRQQDADSFRPDLALVLLSSEDTRLPNPLGWKDVKVAIQVKRKIETPHIQMAQYAHCMKLEQFDRSFLFTLTITENEFRIARWDSAVCYVTPSINYHEDPSSFIHVVGRLACMSPAQLGYDETFSNAGRVLHSQSTQSNRGILTTLTITPCEVVEDLQESSHTAIKEPIRYLLDDDFLCESRDVLFSRSTRVWKAWLITESGLSSLPNAIKQNWHDEDRTNEAWFYEQTKHIEHGIAHMIHFEDLDRTRLASLPIEPQNVQATWIQESRHSPVLEREVSEGDALVLNDLRHRVLVRLVVKEVGLPLSRIKTPRQLVHVIRDIAIALEALYNCNILHRDISEGNILLSSDENAAPGSRAFLADFGLATRINPETKQPLTSSMKHDHMTGTLPFIATIFHWTELYTPLSVIHHDVESLFLVGIYMVFKFASCEGSGSASTRCRKSLAALRSSDTWLLWLQKQAILSFQDHNFLLPGRWFSIRTFLSEVAFVCGARFNVALRNLAAETNPDISNHDIRTIVGAANALDGESSVGLDEPAI
ncbi:hypothetical protein FRC04_010969 [Tulasnella sp. 424]|nr:hypothetical protein FRC04_010969 [Tulasnella sp. 424]KAG8972131.1 hypothetical protein FRC05_010299 [Tulasnella sp. 425]